MPEVITDNIDLWSSALLTRSTAGRGSNGRLEAYGIKKLRELILELAVRGKLVTQEPGDEPASELLKRIQAEKDELIAAGKIKKDKPLPPIEEEDKPFDLPQGWEWVRLGNIAETIRGVTYGKSDASDNPLPDSVPLLRGNNINRFLNFDGLVFVPKKRLNEAQYVKAGDIVIAMSSGSADLVGKAAQATEDFNGGFGAFCGVVRSVSAEVLDFFGFFFQTPLYRIRAAGHGKGIGINNLQKTALQTLEIPLPPIAEQHRIVAKVDELMALCSQLEQQQTNNIEAHQTLVETLLGTLTNVESQEEFAEAWTRIADHFDTLFTTEQSIDQLKQTILQLAVMGKLVPQDLDDEPASVLLGKIAKEKDRLVSEGKIKKEKPLLEIAEEEKPFELPEGWEWARLENLCEIITKGSSPKWQGINYVDADNGILFVTSENVGSFELRLDEPKYVDKMFNEIEPRSILKKYDILMNIVGASIGRTAIYDIETVANINQAVCLIRFIAQNHYVDLRYMLNFFNSSTCVSYMFDKQVDNARANLSMGNISKFSIPLPPLAEQRRIVAKVNELMTLCDTLKDRLAAAQTTQIHLADTIVEQAVA